MSATTVLASRPALVNRTNVYTNNTQSPWSVLQQAGIKRPSSGTEYGSLKKRAKVSSKEEQYNVVENEYSGEESDGNEEMEDIVSARARARRGTVFQMMNTTAMGVPRSRQGLRWSFQHSVVFWTLIIFIASTRPILQTFVSSHKADVFKCYSATPDSYLTPPYACAYSNGKNAFFLP